MSTQNPDEIRADIERTRDRLSYDVDEIGRTVRPSNVVQRQKDKARSAIGGLKERVMGGHDEPDTGHEPSAVEKAGQSLSAVTDSARGSVNDAAQQAGEALSHTPQAARRQMQGNPLAAGLIAFGVGWLAASLLPSTRREQELTLEARRQAQPLLEEAGEAAQHLVEDLKPAAREALAEVKATAQSGVESVKGEGQDAAAQLKDEGVEAKNRVQDQRRADQP